MLRLTASLLPLWLLIAVAEARAQFPQPFTPPFPTPFSTYPHDLAGVEAMRDQILRQAGVLPLANQAGVTQAPLPCNLSTINPMGFTSLPLPNYLRSPELGLPPDCGLIVTQVHPASPAHQAGLRPGMTLVEIDGQPVTASADLHQLTGTHELLVLCDEGLRSIEICQPAAEGLASAEWDSAEWTEHLHSLPRSLSISEANGILAVAAVVDTDRGPQQVELKGTRDQVEAQLLQLCPQVQAALRPHLH